MKAVLISIQPNWCELIESGKKTIEVRKTRPKLETPFKCYIYCTKQRKISDEYWGNRNGHIYIDNGKVVGEYVCDRITEIVCFTDTKDTNIILPKTCLTYEELEQYSNGKTLYGWHISELKIYDKPKELGEFLTPSGTGGVLGNHYITRPPQSWCYVEEIEMNEQELREKIVRILKEAYEPIEYGDDDVHGPQVHYPSDEDAVDALISNGIGDVSEWKRRTEVAERALYNACLGSTNRMLSFLLQAEKELKGEKNG